MPSCAVVLPKREREGKREGTREGGIYLNRNKIN
jgi:hypothetical protein